MPPPLPRGVADGARLVGTPAPLSRCFVCGSTLEGGTCPVCKIAWVE